MTMREVVDNLRVDHECCDPSVCRTHELLDAASAAADRLDAELASAKARNDKLSRALGTTCWQCEKCGEVRDSRPCVYCELAALKAEKVEKAEAAEAWAYLDRPGKDGDDANDMIKANAKLRRYFGRE